MSHQLQRHRSGELRFQTALDVDCGKFFFFGGPLRRLVSTNPHRGSRMPSG